MVFIKLQYKDNIKKILIAKEEVNWEKICEILHSIFKLEDSKSIRLVYKDEEETIGDIEIKSNDQLLDTINKKLIKKFIKFFVFYSGAVENDGDLLYTQMAQEKQGLQESQSKRKGSKGKKKTAPPASTVNKQVISSDENSSQKSLNNNSKTIDQQANNNQSLLSQDNQKQTTSTRRNSNSSASAALSKNSLIQVETQEQFKNILSKAINKSQVFEEIKDKIREFINDPQGQLSGGRLNELKNKNTPKSQQEGEEASEEDEGFDELEELKKKAEEEIEYSIQTNLQHLSDLFVQNIREVIDEQLTLQLDLPSNFKRPPRKYSEDLFEKKKKPLKNRLSSIANKEQSSPLTPSGILKKKLIHGDFKSVEVDKTKSYSAQTLPDDILESKQISDSSKNKHVQIENNSNSSSNTCSISNNLNFTNNSNTLSESIYTPQQDSLFARNLRRKNTNSDRLLELIQEQEKKISNIEESLLKTQKITEQQINKQFEQNFKSIHHLFQSINQQNNLPNLKEEPTLSTAHQELLQSSISNNRNKSISAYELYLLLDKQVQQYSLNEQFKDEDVEQNTPSFFDSLMNEQIILKSKHQRIRSRFFEQMEADKDKEITFEKQVSTPKINLAEDEIKIAKTLTSNQKQVFEDTIVQVVSPLRSFKQSQQNESKTMLQLIKTNHFNLNSESENNTPFNQKIESKQANKAGIKRSQTTDPENGASPITHNSKEIIDEVDDDEDFEQCLPKLIMTKKISCSVFQNV